MTFSGKIRVRAASYSWIGILLFTCVLSLISATPARAADAVLAVTKSGPATMSPGQWGNFSIDVMNTGTSDAWNAAIRDLLPHTATGGMCDLTPEILSAQVFASDGVSPIAGKGPLNPGSDYSLSYSAAPNCQLDITILTAAGTIGPNQRLILRYQTQLDANTLNGVTLTNVAGAIQWFNDNNNNPGRKSYTGTLTSGTPGIQDNQGAYTATVVFSGALFEKTVADLTSGVNLAKTASPGDKLRYTLRIRTTNQALSSFRIFDDMEALNAQSDFTPGTLSLVMFPAGADTSATSSTGGSKGTGVIDIRNLSVPANSQALIQFDITLGPNIATGTVVTNQAVLLANGTTFALSDDPNVNGTADPTRLTIVVPPIDPSASEPALVVRKSGPATLNLAQWGNFGIDVQNIGLTDAWDVSLRDLLPHGATGGMCDLTPEILSAQVFAADGFATVPSKGPLNPGSDYSLSYSAAPNCRLDITMLTAAGKIGANERLIVRYRTKLDANSQNGVTLTNVAGAIQWFNASSNDPNRYAYNRTLSNGTPGILDHEDAFTVTVALSGYSFEKTVADLTSGVNPATKAAPGDKLRYTLRVRATNQALNNFRIFDDMDSLNPQADFTPGTLTLVTSPPGADISATSSTGGTKGTGVIDIRNLNLPVSAEFLIQFDITLKPAVVNGTVVSNQAALFDNGTTVLSDDPNVNGTADPTRVTIVSTAALLYAGKRVALFTDLGSPGIVDPGDVLRYTITVQNSGTIPATGVVLKDPVPANTTYVANSTLVNGLPVGQPDSGASPLASGINISSSNLTPPLPGSGAGTIAPAATAILQYDLRVNPGTPAGTVISNQAVVSSDGLPNLLTDSSGNPANAPKPTVVVVGAGQQVSISAQVSVVGGGAAVPGAQLDYVLNIVNVGAVPAYNVVITDDLNATQPGQLAYTNPSATMNGSASGVSFAGSTITANYGAVNGTLAPGAVVVLRFRTTLNSNLMFGTVVTNKAVAAWNNPTETTSASVSIVVGAIPGFAALNGSAWYDANFDNVEDSRERALAGWTVELYRDNQLSQSVQTDANGVYHIIGVEPNDTTGARYELRFRAPGAGPNTAMLGRGVSPFTNGLQRISDIVVPSSASLQGLNLAIHPNGVIYNSMTRTPVAGATLTLLAARDSSRLPAACFDDAAQQGQLTLADGYYKFDINFNDPACPSGGDYLIGLTAPAGTNYVSGYSQIIPPASSASTTAFSVPACPGSGFDVIPGTAQFCEVQPSEFAPAASVQPRSAGTTYYVHLLLDGNQIPGSSQIFNNHIPVDPQLLGLLTVTKTTSVVNVGRGQLVPYTITANNHSGQLLSDVSIVDRLPAGFSYIKGSALLDGVPTEPSVVGTVLNWNGLVIAGNQVRTVKVLLAVGAGNNEGEYVNHAQALMGANGNALSGEATATVRLVPDPTFDCTDVMGKIFNDKNRNGRQDDGEEGLSGVRVVTPTGLQATTDKYGRYHITCAIVPNDSRGSNFVLKLDDRTLPSGYRMTTDQVQIQRATSGKALQVNFGASIHRVVSIDLLDAAFEPGTTELRVQWKPRINLLLEELRKAPAVLRLSYVADTEDAALVKRRVEAVKRELTERWGAVNAGYVLTIEPEVFWRRGAPPK